MKEISRPSARNLRPGQARYRGLDVVEFEVIAVLVERWGVGRAEAGGAHLSKPAVRPQPDLGDGPVGSQLLQSPRARAAGFGRDVLPFGVGKDGAHDEGEDVGIDLVAAARVADVLRLDVARDFVVWRASDEDDARRVERVVVRPCLDRAVVEQPRVSG